MKQLRINLLPKAARFQLAEIRITRRVRYWAYWVVGFCLLIFSFTFSFKLFLNYRLNKLTKQKRHLEISLREFSPQIELQQMLRYRLKLAAETMKSRQSLTDLAQKINQVLPSGTTIRLIRVKGDYVEISASLPRLIELDQLEKKILAMAKDNFSQVKIRSLSRKENQWFFTLSLRGKKKQ